MASTSAQTPAMQQFTRFKKLHPECVLFFRMGDFYEMFYEDAKLAHKVLGVTLTQRTEGVPMAGVPHHAMEGYLRRMIRAGYRVAVCEQTEDPKQAKGVVKRDVTRIVTPGTLTDESLLDEAAENHLAAVSISKDGRIALAWTELSTGAFHVADLAAGELGDELARISPRELLYAQDDHRQGPPPDLKQVSGMLGSSLAGRPAWQFRTGDALDVLCRQFQVAHLRAFDLAEDDPVLGPAGAIVTYLLETQRTTEGEAAARIPHLQPPRRFRRQDHLIIDQTSLRSLEITRTLRAEGVAGSVLGVLQDCVTGMGKRLLGRWLCYPLRQIEAIQARQRAVAAIVEDPSHLLDPLREALDGISDVERMAGRLSLGRPTPRDLVGLGESLRLLERVAAILADRPAFAQHLDRLRASAGPLESLAERIRAACVDHPPGHVREGGVIRAGYDAALDELAGLQSDSNAWLAQYQARLIQETGITSLKIGFNRVFGYYIELSAVNRDKAPDHWSRKQTLKNAERFITPELKEFEGKITTAESRRIAREQELFAELCARAATEQANLKAFAEVVAELDVLACLARRAIRFRYVQPTIVDEPVLDIRAGRHVVLDEVLGDQFVPNDVLLGGTGGGPEGESSRASLALITGPNMAGKSTYIRQTALIALLAHAGSFVPAESATVGLCDRIFTRVGASDELHAGASTFMVEMTETANICHAATARSLVILDEIGRGTSTLDGLSLAWAIAEHLAQRGCRTLFATHYHEITQLADQYPSVTNLNVTVREWQDEVVFLHRIVPGATNRSYGIHVAKIAGLPATVVDRAGELLSQLAVSHDAESISRQLAAVERPEGTGASRSTRTPPDGQLSLFVEYLDHPVVEKLRKLRVDAMSPIQAFDLLRELKDATAES